MHQRKFPPPNYPPNFFCPNFSNPIFFCPLKIFHLKFSALNCLSSTDRQSLLSYDQSNDELHSLLCVVDSEIQVETSSLDNRWKETESITRSFRGDMSPCVPHLSPCVLQRIIIGILLLVQISLQAQGIVWQPPHLPNILFLFSILDCDGWWSVET